MVSPTGEGVGEVEGYSTLSAIGGDIDLVVMALDANDVLRQLDECASCSVRGIILVTGDFITDHDYSRQQALVARVRELGMRLLGPNSLGLTVNTDPGVSLNASLVTEMPRRGRIGFFSQTGAFGSAILAEAARREFGVSTFVSAGNRADVVRERHAAVLGRRRFDVACCALPGKYRQSAEVHPHRSPLGSTQASRRGEVWARDTGAPVGSCGASNGVGG